MRVGILGSGVVGQTLGTGFAEHGHDVKLGSRDPRKAEVVKWVAGARGKVSAGTFSESALHGEVLVLCCLGVANDEVVALAGPAHFDGKLLIDATNPLDFSKGMPPGLTLGLNDSLGERLQTKLPRARVVKCFNTVPNSRMTHPTGPGGAPTMLLAGNDPAAKAEVVAILREFGWTDSIDVGGIEGARWLEALVPLWARVASKLGDFNSAFKVVT